MADWRRQLGRAITTQARANVKELLDDPPPLTGGGRRIAITGAPGVGKSSIIARLVERIADQGRRVGILAIDPTSPISSGSLLGDRIRMDIVTGRDDVYMRSLPSCTDVDGLCPNILGILSCFDDAGFEDVILETVGAGQMNYGVREVTDCFILVLNPGAGDVIQAMKAGIMEMADIYVVNKADLPDAARMASDLRGLSAWRSDHGGRAAKVIMMSQNDDQGLDELVTVLEEHFQSLDERNSDEETETRRRYFMVRSLLNQQLTEFIKDGSLAKGNPAAVLRQLFGEQSRSDP